ncbi:hypothetical protein RUM44_006795 [Polyplax serrata]|uniref:Uncharacterized protein n=1 Tax=Polyplax serrata TaxID=468196 RepID=A0ABR1AJ54_POLSC
MLSAVCTLADNANPGSGNSEFDFKKVSSKGPFEGLKDNQIGHTIAQIPQNGPANPMPQPNGINRIGVDTNPLTQTLGGGSTPPNGQSGPSGPKFGPGGTYPPVEYTVSDDGLRFQLYGKD